ncbi:MAG TPA: hypothetical protein VD833_19580 [Vicinamibacterales bacterium]|nr:hypothetical protein [Vicinamibacterales bacterium]
MQSNARVRPRLVNAPRAACLLAAGILLSPSCSDGDATQSATGPTFVASSSLTVRAASPTVRAQPVGRPSCPSVAPFTVPIVIVITSTGPDDVVVTGFRLQFTDTLGRRTPQVNLGMPQVTAPMPPVTLPAPVPSDQTAFTRTVPLSFGIGCDTGTSGTIVIVVDTSDRHGRRRGHEVTVAVQ